MFQQWIMTYIMPYLVDVDAMKEITATIPLINAEINAYDLLQVCLAYVLFVVAVRLVYAIWKPLAHLLKVDKPIGKR